MRGYKSFGSDPHPGHLSHRVDIGYTDNTVNENGYPAETDHIVCRVWSAVEDAGNESYRAADNYNAQNVINFTIRYRKDVHVGMWVKFRDEKYQIQAIGSFMFKKQYLGLKSSKTTGIGQ